MAVNTLMTQNSAHARRSALVVIAVTALALLLGWGVKSAVQNQTRPIEQKGITAEIPAGWLVQEGAGELIILARNAQSLDQQYSVSRVSAAADLAGTAGQRNAHRGQLDATYRVLDETPIVVEGHGDGYKVSFAYVDPNPEGAPAVVKGVDYYFPTGDHTLVISFETEQESYVASLPQFQRFLTSVSYQAGE